MHGSFVSSPTNSVTADFKASPSTTSNEEDEEEEEEEDSELFVFSFSLSLVLILREEEGGGGGGGGGAEDIICLTIMCVHVRIRKDCARDSAFVCVSFFLERAGPGEICVALK